MNWYAILGRLAPWVATVGTATFVLVGLDEPTWWPVILSALAPIIQLVLAVVKPKA